MADPRPDQTENAPLESPNNSDKTADIQPVAPQEAAQILRQISATISTRLPEQFGELLLTDKGANVPENAESFVSAEVKSAPDGAVATGTRGDYWKQDKDGWQLHASEGYRRSNPYFEKVTSVTKDDSGNVTLELDCKTKVVYDANARISKMQWADGSNNEYTWSGDKLTGVKQTKDGKTTSFTLGENGRWHDESGKELKFVSFSLDDGGRFNARMGDTESRKLPDGTTIEYTVDRKLSTDGVRQSETVTTKDGKTKFIREYDLTGNTMTRQRAYYEDKILSDKTFKDGKPVKDIGFDATGKKDSQEDFDKDGKCTRSLRFDRTGNVIAKSEYDGDTVTSTSFDASGHKTEQLVRRGLSITAHRKFNREDLVSEERTWDLDGKSSGKKTFEYESGKKTKEKFYAPPAEFLASEATFKDGVKATETFYQTQMPQAALGHKKLEVTYGPGGVKARETSYNLGGAKDSEIEFDTKDPTGQKKLKGRRYGNGAIIEEWKYAADGVTALPGESRPIPPIPIPKK